MCYDSACRVEQCESRCAVLTYAASSAPQCAPGVLLHCSEAVRHFFLFIYLHKCKITRCSRNHLILPFEHPIGCYIVHCISLIILCQTSRYLWPVTSIGSKKHFDFNILLLGVCMSSSRGLLTVADIKRELSIRKSFSTSRHSFAVYIVDHIPKIDTFSVFFIRVVRPRIHYTVNRKAAADVSRFAAVVTIHRFLTLYSIIVCIITIYRHAIIIRR